MINDKVDEVEEHFQLLLFRYRVELEKLMKCSDIIFNFIYLLY